MEQDIANDTNPSKYNMDANETCSVNAQSKDIYDLIEKTNWGSEQSMKCFQIESKTEHAGIRSVVSNATKQHELTSSDLDYHLLGAALCNNLPQKKLRLMASNFLDQPSVVLHVVAIAPLVIKHAKSIFEFILEFYDPIKIGKQHLTGSLP